MSAADRLDAEAIRAAIGDYDVVVLEETTSTNDVVFDLVAAGQQRVVVFAEHQTAGRGQHGNQWESAASRGLWFSLPWGGAIPSDEPWRVTFWAANAIATEINEQLSLGAEVKPPNDVCLDSRKVAGVLLELRALPDSPHIPVLGIGINVNHAVADFPPELRRRATSLALASGKQIERQPLAIALLRRFTRVHPGEPLAINQR